jgi:hypothetical protein
MRVAAGLRGRSEVASLQETLTPESRSSTVVRLKKTASGNTLYDQNTLVSPDMNKYIPKKTASCFKAYPIHLVVFRGCQLQDTLLVTLSSIQPWSFLFYPTNIHLLHSTWSDLAHEIT